MKKNTTPASLLLSIVFLAACSGGHELNCKGKAGKLHTALASKDPAKALEIASSRKLKVNATCSVHNTPALVKAAELGYTAVVVQLLEKGADIDKPNNYGRTALMLAAMRGHLSVVQHLLQRGADIDKLDKSGWTALMWAANAGHLPVVQHLLQRGADIEKQDNYGWTALILAVRFGHLSVVQHLLQRGADIDKQDNYGRTALMLAIGSNRAKGNISLFKALIDTPQNFHLTNEDGQTALEIAEERFKGAKPADKKCYSLVIAMLKQKMRP